MADLMASTYSSRRLKPMAFFSLRFCFSWSRTHCSMSRACCRMLARTQGSLTQETHCVDLLRPLFSFLYELLFLFSVQSYIFLKRLHKLFLPKPDEAAFDLHRKASPSTWGINDQRIVLYRGVSRTVNKLTWCQCVYFVVSRIAN